MNDQMGRVKWIWYLSPMRAAKVQASLRIRAVSPEPSLLALTRSESRGTFRQKARSLAPLNGWACAVKVCHDGMLEDTNSLDGAQIILLDFSKAFDKVNHERLISKLHVYDIRGKTLTWIKAFLNGRSQTVVLEGDCSEEVPVTSGVLQGFVLGQSSS